MSIVNIPEVMKQEPTEKQLIFLYQVIDYLEGVIDEDDLEMLDIDDKVSVSIFLDKYGKIFKKKKFEEVHLDYNEYHPAGRAMRHLEAIGFFDDTDNGTF